MKRHGSIPVFLLCLLLLFNGLQEVSFTSEAAEQVAETKTLIQQEELSIHWDSCYSLEEKTIEWAFYYEYQAPAEREQALKIRFLEESSFLLEKNASTKWHRQEPDWWSSAFSRQQQGVVRFTSSWDKTQATVTVQLDERISAGSTSATVCIDQLSAELAGPYCLEISPPKAITQTETSVSTATNRSTEETLASETKDEEKQAESAFFPTSPSIKVAEKPATTAESSAIQGPNATLLAEKTPLKKNPSLTSQSSFVVADPFFYQTFTEPTGRYPVHHTQQVLGGEALQQESVQNYHYGIPEENGNVPRYALPNSNVPDFARGYHEFGVTPTENGGRLNTKKIVRQLADDEAGQRFEVILDTIGDAEPAAPLDLVLVLERSRRMTGDTSEHDWAQLQQAVEQFVKELFLQGLDVRVGLVGFSQEAEGVLTAELGVMKYRAMRDEDKSYPENYRYDDFFADNPETIVKREILKLPPGATTGAPTHLGVDAGLFLLSLPKTGRETATKMLCTITAGDPTYTPTLRYYQKSESGEEAASVRESLANCEFDGAASTRKFFRCKKPEYIAGDGQKATLEELEMAQRFFQLRQEQLAQPSWQAIQYLEGHPGDLLPTLGANKFSQAKNLEELTKALQNSLVLPKATVYQGTLVERFSPYVTLDQESVCIAPLAISETGELQVVPDFEESAEPERPLVLTAETEITLKNLTLGRRRDLRQGLRLSYEVSLKEAYRDGSFYPIGQESYLAMGDLIKAYYAQPSIRERTVLPEPREVDVFVTTLVKGSTQGIPEMQYGLFSGEADGEALALSTLADARGQVCFTGILPGTYWLRELRVPAAFLSGTPLCVTILENGAVTGLASSGNTIEKELKPLHVVLRQQVGENLLSAGAFTLVRGDERLPFLETGQGEFQVAGITPGQYLVTEVTPPLGYQPLVNQGVVGVLEVSALGEITFSQEGSSVSSDAEKRKVTLPVLQRRLKEYRVAIKQTLAGIEDEEVPFTTAFELYDQAPSEHSEVAPLAYCDTQGMFTKDQEPVFLQPQTTYYLKESATSKDILPMREVLSFSITKSGDVILETAPSQVTKVSTHFTLATANLPNRLQIHLVRQGVQPLPDTGGQTENQSWIPWLFLSIGLVGCLIGITGDADQKEV